MITTEKFTDTGFFLTRLESGFSNVEFKNYWNNLAIDKYIEGPNKFRERKYSHLKFDAINKTIKNFGSVYFQEEEFNNLFGGQKRTFSPVAPEFLNNSLFRYLLNFDFEFFLEQGLLEKKIYDIGIHQIRTIAKLQDLGKVTPEGIHKDGHPVFGIHLVNREYIKGGRTNLYSNDFEKIESLVLEDFGDTLLIEDDALYHEVTPIAQESQDRKGYRDVLIIEFY